jgi:hypothetical protein
MSYTLVPYLIDLGRLQAVAGGGDAALVDALSAKYPRRVNGPVLEALSRIVHGRIDPDPGGAAAYAVALGALCDHLGERLDNEMFQDTGGDYLSEAGLDDLLQTGPPLPIPHTGDFPVVGHLPPQRAAEEVARLERLPPHPDPIVMRGRSQYDDWLQAATREQRGIVVYYA